MSQRTDIWTILIITAVSVLVWYWAASETRVTETLPPMRIEFTLPESDRWLINPSSMAVTLTAVGSQRSIRDAEGLDVLEVSLKPEVGEQFVDVLEAVSRHVRIQESGVSVVSVTPSDATIEVDQYVRIPARVRPILAGVQTVGDIVVEPPQVTVSMPGLLRRFYPDDLIVEAFIQRGELERLQAGIAHTIEDVPLRLPEQLTSDSSISISPQRVRLTFTVRSQLRDIVLDTPVRIKIAGAPEDEELIELEPKQLRDVKVTAPYDLIAKIESGEAVVVAVLHLKSSEKEARITSKPITCFMALLPDESGVVIDARMRDTGETRPLVGVTVRQPGP